MGGKIEDNYNPKYMCESPDLIPPKYSLLPTLLPNLAQIPVIAPLAPHKRRLRHKLFGTDRARSCRTPAPGTPRCSTRPGCSPLSCRPSGNRAKPGPKPRRTTPLFPEGVTRIMSRLSCLCPVYSDAFYHAHQARYEELSEGGNTHLSPLL